MPDFLFEDHGTVWLVRAQSREAFAHLRENVEDDAQWLGDALACEHRYARSLAWDLKENGYTVGGDL